MSPHETSLAVQVGLAIVKTLILLIGGLVSYLAYKAHRRTGSESLRLLSIGFGLVVVGVFLAGVTFELVGVPLGVGVLIESLFGLAGLAIIAYSLRVTRTY